MNPEGILETCLYCDNLNAAERFYHDVFGLEVVARQDDRHVFFRCGNAMLLLFNPRRTADESNSIDGATIPRHGASGPGHVAFSVDHRDVESWREQFDRHGVPIESEVRWPNGGRSIYVRDPGANSVEVATPDLWGV